MTKNNYRYKIISIADILGAIISISYRFQKYDIEPALLHCINRIIILC